MFTNGKYFNDKNTTMLRDDGTAYPGARKTIRPPKQSGAQQQGTTGIDTENSSAKNDSLVAATEEDYRRAQELGEQNILPPSLANSSKSGEGNRTAASNDPRVGTFFAWQEEQQAAREALMKRADTLRNIASTSERMLAEVKELWSNIESGKTQPGNFERKREYIAFLAEKHQQNTERLAQVRRDQYDIIVQQIDNSNMFNIQKNAALSILSDLPEEKYTDLLCMVADKGVKKVFISNRDETLRDLLTVEDESSVETHPLSESDSQFRPGISFHDDAVAKETGAEVSDIYYYDGEYRFKLTFNVLNAWGAPRYDDVTVSLGKKLPGKTRVQLKHPSLANVLLQHTRDEFVSWEYLSFFLSGMFGAAADPIDTMTASNNGTVLANAASIADNLLSDYARQADDQNENRFALGTDSVIYIISTWNEADDTHTSDYFAGTLY